MKLITRLMATAFAAAVTLTACQDSVSDIGSTLVADNLQIVVDSSFTVSGHSVENNRIQSRTTTQLLGAIRADNYGTLSSDYVTQLFPSNGVDTIGITADDIDSVKVLLVFDKGGFVGDSLMPLGVKVYPLKKQLPYPIYSDFDATDYYDASSPWGSAAYTAAGIGVSDTMAGNSYRYVYVNMPLQTGKNIFNKYIADPQLFNSPELFAEYFPGLYVSTSFGSGRVTRITDTRWIMYYHRISQIENDEGEMVDSLTTHYGIYMASAPEVVSNSNIRLSLSQTLRDMASAGRTIVVSPAGYDVEIEFPINDILRSYRAKAGSLSVVNSLSFSVPATEIINDAEIGMPNYLLMVLSSEKESFFASNDLPDSKTSFLGTYNSDTGCYEFADMYEYLLKYTATTGDVEAKDYTFSLTPISIVTESTGSSTSSYYYYYYYSSSSTSTETMSGIAPLVSLPGMVELDLSKAKIKMTFSTQVIK
jgi:hypothetical protein